MKTRLPFKSTRTEQLAIAIGKLYGSISKNPFLPQSFKGIDFTHIYGQTTRLVGKSLVPLAFDPCEIKKKCVLSLNNELTGTYLITSMANHLETD